LKLLFTTQYDDAKGKSVFLAGPTPRSSTVKSWRPEAIQIFQDLGFDGTLYIPEPDWVSGIVFEDFHKMGVTDDKIIEWEHTYLLDATAILMWVPRDLVTMPSFTTNIEFGLWAKSEKLVYGRPDNAPKNDYLDYCYRKFLKKEPINDLKELIKVIVEDINYF